MRSLHFAGVVLILCGSGCQGWKVQPVSINAFTPLPSGTPVIDSPTPHLLTPTQARAAIASMTLEGPTETRSPASSQEPTVTPTATLQLGAKILACGTGVDVTLPMGHVTDAYVGITNAGSSDAQSVCATLRGLHEGQVHPDKTQCLGDLPAGYRATLKLTISSTADQSTPIQVEVTSQGVLLLRLGESACPGPVPRPEQYGSLKTPQPIP